MEHISNTLISGKEQLTLIAYMLFLKTHKTHVMQIDNDRNVNIEIENLV
jgi:hypothetical protein